MLYERTLGQWLEHWATTTPDKEYIVYSDRNLRFTWSQFQPQSGRHGKRTYRYRRGTGNIRRHLGGKTYRTG